MSKKVSYKLHNLGCSNCAVKIEKEVGDLPLIKAATLNFLDKKIVIDVDDEDEDAANDIKEQISKIAKSHEPKIDVKSLNEKQDQHNKIESKINIAVIQCVTAIILFVTGLLTHEKEYISATIFIAAYLLAGFSVIRASISNIMKGRIFDENFLMTIATIGAFVIGEFAEAAAVMIFYFVGELFQDYAVDKSKNAITSLMDIRPDTARLKKGNELIVVNPVDVEIGQIISVHPGERIPLDGEIVSGQALLDTSALTGESVPQLKSSGENVLSGSVVVDSVLEIKVSQNFESSTLSRILKLVQDAAGKKAKTERFITRFAGYYTPVVVFSALIVAIIPPMLSYGTFAQWGYRALVFLVISCPCALMLSIPLGFFAGIGTSSKNGILVKGGNYLEILNSVSTVVFDKTGTLTKGVFSVTEVDVEHPYSENEILRFAAHAEMFSSHPIALSIVERYKHPLDNTIVKNYQEISGHGIKAEIDGHQVVIGNHVLFKKEEIIFEEKCYTGTHIHVAIDNHAAGVITIADVIKDDAPAAIESLKKMGKKIIMLTGDSQTVADHVAEKLGIDTYYAELLPEDKVNKMEELTKSEQSEHVAFVGDGINDAPVIMRADVGIAMGGIGSDAAVEAADIVLMEDEPSKLVQAFKISAFTKKIVWQNIIFAFGFKLIVLALGAAGIASLWIAVFADVGVALLAVLNSLRIMRL